MNVVTSLEGVRKLSDEELLGGLRNALGSSRRLVAVVLAHLAEVEERRLHSVAGHSSLFGYCTARLAMSEDEAFRRIRVARLARRFPSILDLIARGQVTLSVVALLDSLLTEANHEALLEAVTGKTVARAREVIAAWFPQPDVLPLIRKLPTRPARASSTTANAPAAPPGPSDAGDGAGNVSPADATHTADVPTTGPLRRDDRAGQLPAALSPGRSRPSTCVEPLSPARYKVQFTADAELKRKLDLARDLLRHAVPSGDLAAIVGRALDLLIEKTLQRRFGKAKRPRTAATTPEAPPPSTRSDATPISPPAAAPAMPTPARRGSHLPLAVRRAALERDGLRCTYRAPDGTRCESRAWLEHDHIDPAARVAATPPKTSGFAAAPITA